MKDERPKGQKVKAMQPKLTVLSYGGGQDSTAILYKLAYDDGFRAKYAPGRLIVVMSDTGDEHPATYIHVNETKAFCRARGIEFKFIRKEDGFHLDSWPSLREFYARTSTVGSKSFPKTCTDNLKIRPIYFFLAHWLHTNYGVDLKRDKAFVQFADKFGKIRVLIGIAKGEESRRADPEKSRSKWFRDSVDVVYPLIDIGLDREGCQAYIASTGRKVPPPSNCMLCPFMSKIELLWLHRNYPRDLQEWVAIERRKLGANTHKGEKNLGVWGRKTLPQVLDEAIAEHGHMTLDQLHEYKQSHGHCVKSKY